MDDRRHPITTTRLAPQVGQLGGIALTLDDLAAPVFVSDAAGRLLDVNTAACASLGYDRAELLALSAAGLDTGWGAEAVRDLWRTPEGAVTVESSHRRKDGSTFPVEMVAHTVPGQNGPVVVVTVRDVSAETALKRSEAELRGLLDNVPDVYYRTDRDGRIVAVSRSVTDLLGYQPDEFIGRNVRTLYVDPAQRDRLVKATEDRGGRINEFDIELRRKNGSTVWLSISAQRLGDHSDEGLEGFLRDVTDRRLAEMRLHENREVTQALLNATTDATMLMARDGTLLACNSVFATRFGRRPEECAGHNLFAMFPPDVAARRNKACEEAFATGQPVRLLDSRSARSFDNTITPIPNAAGIMDRLAIFSRDVTADLAARAAVAEHLAEVERSNADLEQFAYVASHDLREPLRLVANYVSLLERRYADRLDQDARDFIGFARDGARRMDRLILDLLEYSRVSRADVSLQPVTLAEAFGEAMANLAFAVNGAKITMAIEPGLRVRGDLSQLTRLVQNLIGNGLKYRSDDRPARIDITARADGGIAELRVADNGIGIEPTYFERIFRIFQRLHPQGRFEGTGIGLAICRRIAERHGGTITLESQPGHGSTFIVRLPQA